MENNPWIVGSLMILGGSFIGMGGFKWYSYVFASVGAIISWGVLWAFMLLYQEPDLGWRKFLLDFFMSGTVFVILFRF